MNSEKSECSFLSNFFKAVHKRGVIKDRKFNDKEDQQETSFNLKINIKLL